MNGFLMSKVFHLMSTGGSRGHEDGSWFLIPSRRQQAAFPDLLRDVVVLPQISEGPGHAATARIELYHLALRDACEQSPGRLHESHRLLVTMAMKQDFSRAGLES